MKNFFPVLLCVLLALVSCGKETPGQNQDSPSVTGSATDITSSSATITGYANISPGITGTKKFGILCSTDSKPGFDNGLTFYSTDLDSNNQYSVKATGLSPSKKYYYRSFLSVDGINYMGDVKDFTTTSSSESPNIPDAVDLGLPSGIKWASCNLGAGKPEDYGDYYAWGATEPWYNGDSQSPSSWKKSGGYTWANCPFMGGRNSYDLSYWNAHKSECVDANNILLPANDAAHVNLGGKWRIPTREEWSELKNTDNCSWTWTTINGINGYKVQSKKSGFTGNMIFLPAAGCRDDDGLRSAGSTGYYWSSSLLTDDVISAHALHFNSNVMVMGYGWRRYGHAVRPVSD